MDEETIHRLQERINELEKRVDFLYDRMNISHPMSFVSDPELIAAIRKGDKIEAIKIYRRITNCDLADAKNAVEGMWNQY